MMFIYITNILSESAAWDRWQIEFALKTVNLLAGFILTVDALGLSYAGECKPILFDGRGCRRNGRGGGVRILNCD